MSGKGYFEHCTKCHPEIDVKWPVVSGVVKTGTSVICYSYYLPIFEKKEKVTHVTCITLINLMH